MSPSDTTPRRAPIRREPPAFRRLEVAHVGLLAPRMARVRLAGALLDGFTVGHPAASVRLLVPSPPSDELIIPIWNGNEFLLPAGDRPVIRTFTPRHFDAAGLTLDLDIVLHDGGAVSAWVEGTGRGDPAAISGPGRGYSIDLTAPGFLLAGDETAVPAISQLLETIPREIPVATIVEVVDGDARPPLPTHPLATFKWVELAPDGDPGSSLVPAVASSGVDPGFRVWAAGEAAAMHRIRGLLFDEIGLERSLATVRGYWKQGRRPAG